MPAYLTYPKINKPTDDKQTQLWQLLFKCSFIIVLLGVINLVVYYYAFNIPIIDYLETPEISTVLLSQLPNYLLLLIPILTTLQWRRLIFLQLSAFLLIVHFISSNTSTEAKGQFMMVCAVVYSPMMLPFFRQSLQPNSWHHQNNQWKVITYVVITVTLITGVNSWLKAALVKNRILYYGTTMILDGKKITADSSYYFVGQTRKYIFWYNALEKNPVIYPAEKLEKIELKTIDIESPFNFNSIYCDSVVKAHMKNGR